LGERYWEYCSLRPVWVKVRLHLYQQVRHGGVMSVIPAIQGGIGRRITVQGRLQEKCKTLPEKELKYKRTRGMAKGLELLPSNGKALSSNPSTVKNKIKTKTNTISFYSVVLSYYMNSLERFACI
jgi:hypothetical protein